MGIVPGHDPDAVERAARALAEGRLVAFATETVYGLGARADDDRAVARIFAAKGRPNDHPLIVHVAEAVSVEALALEVPAWARRLMDQLWPGPVSLVFRRRPGVAEAAAAGLPTIAVRCPSHVVAQALLRRAAAWGVAGVAAPSANRFGRVSPTRAEHVCDEFGPDLMVLDGGPCAQGIESAIVDCSGAAPRLLRPGSLSRQALEAALGQALDDRRADVPRVSGSLDSHYAPSAAVVLAEPHALPLTCAALADTHGAAALAVWSRSPPATVPAAAWCPMPDNAADAARQLFDTLRRYDAQGARAICVELPPPDPDWEGVRDRLQRAAAPR